MAPRPTKADLATRPIINPAPDSMPDRVPQSIPYEGAAEILPNSEVMQDWTPYGTKQARPYFGGWDPLSQAGRGLMHTAQASLYDASPNPWPNNAQYDRPNGFFAQLLRLQPTTSAHRGRTQPTGAGPTMLFHAPPVFSVQSTPIPAVGV